LVGQCTGVSVNDIADLNEVDAVTKHAAFSGQPVTIQKSTNQANQYA